MGEPHHSKPPRQKFCQYLWQTVDDAFFSCDSEGQIVMANPAFTALMERAGEASFLCPDEGMQSAGLSRIIARYNQEVLLDGQTRSFEFVMTSPQGLRFFSVTKGLCQEKCHSSRKSSRVMAVARDITELRGIERQIIDTGDLEKERLGHELRENFCQHLVGISLLGNVLFEELSRAGLEQARFARHISTLVKEVVSEVRALEKGLSAAHLEQGEGLVEALRDLSETLRFQSRVDCSFQAPAFMPEVAPGTAMYLFRIAQEAVSSALRRGTVKRMAIRFKAVQGALVLSVRDDGPEFPEGVEVEEWVRGEFPIMHYRSRVIGARLEFKRIRRGGVEVVCSIPRYSRAQPKNANKRKKAQKRQKEGVV